MTSRNEAKLNMFRATLNHCNDNAAIVSTVPAFAATLTTFNETVNTIMSITQQEDVITKGITVDKTVARKALCQLAADIAAPIFAFAAANKNNTLKQSVKFTITHLLKTKEDILAPRCRNIVDVGTEYLAGLVSYGVTADTITALQTSIHHYEAKLTMPRNSAALKKTTRENLRNMVKEAETILKEQMDKTVVVFKATHPDFVATYKTNRSIIDPKQTTTTLKGAVTGAKDQLPVSGATVLVKETGTEVSAGEKGNYEIKPLPAGIYTIEVSAPGYKNTTAKEVVVKQGQVTCLNIILKPL